MPNLEPPECAASRQIVKEFYSYHFGNEMRFSPENLKPLEKFLTADYFSSLQNLKTDGDVFTTGDLDYPKAFRIGQCEVVSAEKTNVEVLLFWRTDTRSEQRSIHAETVNRSGQWLINKVDK